MRVPTVRIANPAAPGSFMTINAADLADHHEMWPDQAADYVAPLRTVDGARRMDPAVRDAAAALCLRMIALRQQVTGEPFADLPRAEQLAVIHAMEGEFTQFEADVVPEAPRREDLEVAIPDLRVTKGPRGRWYVKRGSENVAGPFDTEAEATAAATSA